MSFVKIHDLILRSSIIEADIHIRWVWIGLLTLCDAEGKIRGTRSALARCLNVSKPQFDEAVELLTSPDPDSTSEVEEGRRLAECGPNRWQIINYAYYRELRSHEDRKEYKRDYQREYMRNRRAAEKANESKDVRQALDSVRHVNPIVEAEVEAEVEGEGEGRDSGDSHVTCPAPDNTPPPDTLVEVPCTDGTYYLTTTRRDELEAECSTVDAVAVGEDMAKKKRMGARPMKTRTETDGELARWVAQESKSGGNGNQQPEQHQDPGLGDWGLPWSPMDQERYSKHENWKLYTDAMLEYQGAAPRPSFIEWAEAS